MFNKSQTELERQQQADAGRLLAQQDTNDIRVSRPTSKHVYTSANDSADKRGSASDASKSTFVARGHDAVLKAAQDRNARVQFTIEGKDYIGVIVARDRYTISAIFEGDTSATIIYKHVIAMFKVLKDDKRA